jgi:hypothetical protein
MLDEPGRRTVADRARITFNQSLRHMPVIFLEYLEHGDLWEWLRRRWVLEVDEAGNEKRVYDPLSNKVLWMIFGCCRFINLLHHAPYIS